MSEFISWKAQPIFISSTFTDMMAERDALRDFVFPELAERLRARQIHLEPIDLRWGVETTDRKEQEEKELVVLKVCLDEIDRCKPFLIGLIGDRYGWVPPAGRMKAAENEKGFTSTIENKSITALEIEYGVLADADQKLRSRFYFREPLDYDKMSPEKAKEFSDMHNPELDKVFAENRLRDYKARIVAKVGKEKVYNYSNIEDFQKNVLEHIWEELDAQTKDQKDMRPKSWQQEEQQYLDEFIEERSLAFAGREDVVNHLIDFASSPMSYENCGICLSGESGSGKSALFAKLHKELRKENVVLLAHAAGISLRSNSLENMLVLWIEELASVLKIDIADQLKSTNKFNDLTKLFAELLSQTSVDHRVIVMVDALNQFERTDHAKYVNWIPELLPKNVKFIFTAIPGDETTNLSKWKGIKIEELKAVTKSDAEKIIKIICTRYRKSLNAEVIELLLCKKTDNGASAYSNPLWLNMAVDEFLLLDEDDFAGLKTFTGTAEEKLKQLLHNTAREMPADIDGMYGYLFVKTRQRFGGDFVNAFLGYLAISRYGLRESDLEKLLIEYEGLNWDQLKFAALRRYLRAHLVRKGEEGLWDFRHTMVRAGINKLLLTSKEKIIHLHQRIALHLEGLSEDDLIRMTEIMWHLFKANETVKAAEIYGSFLTYTQQTKEHSKALINIILEDEANVKWISDIAELKELDEDVKYNIIVNFLFQLASQLKDSIKLREQKIIFLSVLKSTKIFSSGNPDDARCVGLAYERMEDIYTALGDTKNALASCESSLNIAEELYKRIPNSALFARDLLVQYERLGDIYETMGDTKNALTSYNRSMKIAKELREIDPDSAENALDLSRSFERIGSVYETKGDTKNALTSYNNSLKIAKELREIDPDSAEYANNLSFYIHKIGGIYETMGDTKSALTNFESTMKIRLELRKRNPNSAEYARNLGQSYSRIGNIYFELGDFTNALTSFINLLTIAEELHKRDLDSALYASDLSVSYQRIGDIHKEQGDIKNAIKSYESALKITEELRKRDPHSALFARGLALSYEREGDIYGALDNTTSSHEKYKDAIKIIEELYKMDTASSLYKKDLIRCNNKAGDIYAAQGDTKNAIKSYVSSLKIAEELRKIVPESAEYTRDVFARYNAIGDIYIAQGDTRSGIKSYESSLKIAEELRKRNLDSAEYNHDFLITSIKIGDIYIAQGDTKSGIKSYESSLKIAEELRKRNLDSAEYIRELSVLYERVGDTYKTMGDAKSALTNYDSSFNILEELRKIDPDSALYARDLSVLYDRIGDMYLAQDLMKSALTSYQNSLKIREDLRKRNPDSAEYTRDLFVSYNKIENINKLTKAEGGLKSYTKFIKIYKELRKGNPDSETYARDLVVSYLKLFKIDDLKEALIYMIKKNIYMDSQLVKVCKKLGIPIMMNANKLGEITEEENIDDSRLKVAENCFQEQKWKVAEQLFLNLLMENIVAENLQYKLAVCILNGNEILSNDQRARVVNLISQMNVNGQIKEAEEITQILSKKNN